MSAWESAIDKGEDREFIEQVARAEREMEFFRQTCHNAAHIAGKYAVSQTGDYSSWMGRARDYPYTCSLGFIHGIIDYFASTDPDPQAMVEFVSYCKELEGAGTQDCADGVGHALWQLSFDEPTAVGMCERFADKRLVVGCVAGLVMQAFNFGHDGKNGFMPAYMSPLATPALCERLVAAADPDSRSAVEEGCGAGAGHANAEPAWDASKDIENALISGEEVPPSRFDDLAEVWEDVFTTCSLLTGGAQAGCNWNLPMLIYNSDASESQRVVSEICPRMGLEEGGLCYGNPEGPVLDMAERLARKAAYERDRGLQ